MVSFQISSAEIIPLKKPNLLKTKAKKELFSNFIIPQNKPSKEKIGLPDKPLNPKENTIRH